MAIKKIVELRNGTSGEYLRISEMYLRNGSLEATVKVQLWKDSSVRFQGDRTFIEEYCVGIELTGEGTTLQQCYNGLKALSDFSDAEDI